MHKPRFYTRVMLVSAGVTLMVLALYRLNSQLWRGHPALPLLIDLMPDRCDLLCGYAYSLGFENVLKALLVAMLLVAMGLYPRQPALRDLNIVLRWQMWPSASRWRRASLMSGAAALLVLGVALHRDGLPGVGTWALAIVLGGVAVYCHDRAADRRGVFTRGEFFAIVATLGTLLGLGFVYRHVDTHSVLARVMISGGVLAWLGAAWWRWRWRGAGVLALLVMAFGLYTYRLDSWKFAFVGDEYPFYSTAYSILYNGIYPDPLSMKGVFWLNPALSSYVHAASMWLFGADVYGWHVSEVLMVLLGGGALFVFVRCFTGLGLAALTLYLSSHYLLAISKIGYNNLQALPLFLASLAFMGLALRRANLLSIYLSGVMAALSFYVYGVAIPLVPLPALLLGLTFVRVPPDGWRTHLLMLLVAALVFGLGVGLTAYPRLLQTDWIERLETKTYRYTEIPNVTDPWRQAVGPNTLYTLTGFLHIWEYRSSHYVVGSYVDPLTALLVLVGVTWVLTRPRRLGVWLLVAIAYASFTSGGVVSYDYPSVTRNFILVPLYVVAATVALGYVVPRGAVGHRIRSLPLVLIIVLVVGLNLYQFFRVSETEAVRTRGAMVLHELQRYDDGRTMFLIAGGGFNAPTYDLMLRAHEMDASRLVVIYEEDPELAAGFILREGRPPYNILIDHRLEELRHWLAVFSELWDPLRHTVLRDAVHPYLYRFEVNTNDFRR